MVFMVGFEFRHFVGSGAGFILPVTLRQEPPGRRARSGKAK
jgi:hypothetical protein